MKHHHLLILAGIISLFFAPSAQADLDLTFGTGGKVTTSFSGWPFAAGWSVAVQEDGKIVVAGTVGDEDGIVNNLALARYNSIDGNLDPDFGAGGRVITSFDGEWTSALSVALQADGKIVVAGYDGDSLAVVRYNANGSLDGSFGSGGKVTTNFDEAGDEPYASGWSVAVQPDGKIIVAGSFQEYFEDDDEYRGKLVLVRYHTNGSLDDSFGSGGKVTTSFDGFTFNAWGESIAIQNDGKILVGATLVDQGLGMNVALLRYNDNGSLDGGFGSDGKIITSFGNGYSHSANVMLQPDGKILFAGYFIGTFGEGSALIRYNSSGSVDSDFGVGGQITTDITIAFGSGLALQDDGKIVLAGYEFTASFSSHFALTRYNPGGSLDTSFGSSGKITTSFGGEGSQGSSVAVQASGKIVMAGTVWPNATSSGFALARYNAGSSSFFISSASQSVPAAGGAFEFDVTATDAWSWSQSAGSDWLTSSEAVNQSGNRTFSYTVAPNPSVSGRSATITLTSGALTVIHTITQAGDIVSGGGVVAWGANWSGQRNIPTGLNGVTTAIAAGGHHTVALKSDGTVVAWGDNDYGQADVPTGLSGVIAIAAGDWHTVALKSDGTVVAWGDNEDGQTDVPEGLNDVIAIAAGGYYTAALKSDGTVVVFNAPWLSPPDDLNDVVAIAVGWNHIAALKSDGTVATWGEVGDEGSTEMPEGLSGVIAIAAGFDYTLALKEDGTVVAWGVNWEGQRNVPTGLSGVIAIAAGDSHAVALKNDGTVVAWGRNLEGQRNVPVGLNGVIAIAAGGSHTVALKTDSTPPNTSDTKNPTLKLTTPAANKLASSILPLFVTGTAGDNVGVDRVEIVLNGGAPILATWETRGKSISFSAEIVPLAGGNTLVVIAYDAAGNSVSVTRSFTFEQRYTLSLSRDVSNAAPAAQDTPDRAGTLAFKAAPAKNATKLTRDPDLQTSDVLPGTQVTVTASAKVGHLFKHWEGLESLLPATQAVAVGNVLTFTMPEEDVLDLTAVFIANPFTSPELEPGVPNPFLALGSKPVFQGVLLPDSEITASNATVGLLSAALVVSKGSLSGRVLLDGKTTSFTGVLQGNGSVWFKVGKTLAATLPLLDSTVTGKTLAASWSADGLQATVTAPGDAVSTGLAQPARYSRSNPIPAPAEGVRGLLNRSKGKQGYFTLALPAREPASPEDAATYPQGTGYTTLTLANTGTLKLTGVLADGTKITASSFLVAGDRSPVFIQLRTPGGKASERNGSFSGDLVFDTDPADSDVGGEDWRWFRPEAKTKANKAQAYRAGWPEGIYLDPVGALYDATQPAQTALGLGEVDATSGNAVLVFAEGKLTTPVPKGINLSGNKVLKLDPKDKSHTLSVAAKTGLIKGSFEPNWESRSKKNPAFQGVLLQKGGNRGGFGFFLSNAAGDIAPESGNVTLEAP